MSGRAFPAARDSVARVRAGGYLANLSNDGAHVFGNSGKFLVDMGGEVVANLRSQVRPRPAEVRREFESQPPKR